ncbi:MAG TPA: biotin/lipoyl-binding protein [Dongiaceae bacterium]|nr:biotin/lipoyl-binding protein [Dongiaceae bacterium]
MKIGRRAVIGTVLLVALGAVAVGIGRMRAAPERGPLVGMVRETEVRIAPEVGGRLAAFKVKEGDAVKQGDVLAVISNPELSAALEEAKAAAATAKAARDRVYAGLRAEAVAGIARGVDIAEANLTFARQQRARSSALAPKNFVSGQRVDEDAAAVAEAEAELKLRQAELAEAEAGPTQEERASADAKVAAADAAVAVLQAELDKTTLAAPADGRVAILVAEPGEAVVPGGAVLTLYADRGRWFGFTAREDRIVGLKVGATLDLTAADGKRIAARVAELRPLGEFATWRATRAVGSHDLNSFLIRVEPVESTGLAAGMTVFAAPGE